MDKTFVKGLMLIECLADSAEPRGVSSLARELSLTKSNIHRLLMTLAAVGYVRKVETGATYELTSKLWEVGARVRSRLDVLKIAHDHMVRLCNTTGESVHLSILDGFEVVYVDKIEGSQPIKAYTSIGGRAPAWCVATGKAMLAHAPRDSILALEPRLTPFTDHTITKLDQLVEELATVRHEGYAVNREEWRESVSGIASPLRDGNGMVVAAVGISGPSNRFRHKQIKILSTTVISVAASISSDLGYRNQASP